LNHAVKIQRDYYTETADRYEQMHEQESSGDALTMKFVYSMLQMIHARSVLDVGTATGRGMRNLREAMPGLFVCGAEPVAALVARGLQLGNGAYGRFIRCAGEALPFSDGSFDAVCEFGILHHVPDPRTVVTEMLRVAKKAVFLCDSNRFGQGSLSARFAKLALYKANLWRAYNYLRTGGRSYRITDGDGLAYSYSVYDSFRQIAQWADRLILIPADGSKASSWLHPLLNSSGVLVCAVREVPRVDESQVAKLAVGR